MSQPLFVGREREISRLGALFEVCAAGQPRACLVAGEPGAGKTALVQEMLRRIAGSSEGSLIAVGECSATTGSGDAYLPFREILATLAGENGQGAEGHAPSGDRFRRLAQASGKVVLDHAPDLLNMLLPGSSLLAQAGLRIAREAGLIRGEDRDGREDSGKPGDLDRDRIFQQYTELLSALGRQHPVVLVVEDLHWADASSVALFFHLARHLRERRVLLLGTYRPNDVALGRGGERHPLEPVLNELKRYFGEVVIDLESSGAEERRAFVDSFLDAEPNRFGETFRAALFRHTDGNPLFTVELLRSLKERGDVVQDGSGHWTEGPSLDWRALPARVEGVIAERLDRLDDPLREAVRVASVGGLEFFAQVVAAIQGLDERTLLKQLSQELDRRHRLVQEGTVRRLGRRLLSQYRFTHVLFQRYLYEELSAGERMLLHGQTAEQLEEIYQDRLDEIAVDLAHHYDQAGDVEKAIHFLTLSGERAVHLGAYHEALSHFDRAQQLLQSLPDSHASRRAELRLALRRCTVLQSIRGWASAEVEMAWYQAQELRPETGDSPEAAQILFGMAWFRLIRGDLAASLEMAMACLDFGERTSRPDAQVAAYVALAHTLFWCGDLGASQESVNQVLTLHDATAGRAHLVDYGQDPRVVVLTLSAWIAWLEGYPDLALGICEELVEHGEEAAHPTSLAYGLMAACWIHQNRREPEAVRIRADSLVKMAEEHGLHPYRGLGFLFRGWSMAELGDAGGIEEIRRGLRIWGEAGGGLTRTFGCILLAEAYRRHGRLSQALAAIEEGLAQARQRGEAVYEAELYRLRGEIFLGPPERDEERGEADLRQAVALARSRGQTMLELRAAASLARFMEQRDLLGETYERFTEGFDTADLQDAAALLNRSRSPSISPAA